MWRCYQAPSTRVALVGMQSDMPSLYELPITRAVPVAVQRGPLSGMGALEEGLREASRTFRRQTCNVNLEPAFFCKCRSLTFQPSHTCSKFCQEWEKATCVVETGAAHRWIVLVGLRLTSSGNVKFWELFAPEN